MTERSAKDVLDEVEANTIRFARLQFTDIPGSLKGVTVPASRLATAFSDGVWVDGSAVEGPARVAEQDLYLRPDPATYQVVPWIESPTARLFCDLYGPGDEPFATDPRRCLKLALADADALGYEYRVACELEFSIFQRPVQTSAGPLVAIDAGGYFDVATERGDEICRLATEALAGFGVHVATAHHEVAPGQYEIDLGEMGALALADAIIDLKAALRAYGRAAGLIVSFMPKPIADVSGSGLHVQQRLLRNGRDAFFAPDLPYSLAATGRAFIAGQIAHARGMSAVIAPLVNSYKRLMGGAEAPAHITWARTNRGALIRVPDANASDQTRIELRAPDPSCNPYLALSVMLRSGLDGIVKDTELPDPIEEPLQRSLRATESELAALLPRTLDEALEALEWDPVVRDALGQPVYERFVDAKEREWEAHSRYISAWELATYLEGS